MPLAFVSGQLLTASALNALIPVEVIKAVNQTVTSSTVLVNDSELAVTLTAGRTYKIQLGLIANGAVAGDIKVAWAVSSGTMTMVGTRLATGPAASTTTTADTTARVSASQTSLTLANSYGCDTTLQTGITEEFLISVTVTGVLTVQWAQNASSGTATTVGSGSWILATPIL